MTTLLLVARLVAARPADSSLGAALSGLWRPLRGLPTARWLVTARWLLVRTPRPPALLLSAASRRLALLTLLPVLALLTLLSSLRLLRLLATGRPALLAGGLLPTGLSMSGLAMLSGLSLLPGLAALLAELLLATATGRLLSGAALLPSLRWLLASLLALLGLRRLLAAELSTRLPRLSLLPT